MSVNNVNPSTLFGGTWARLKDRFLLGVGDTYKEVSKTGGEATHKLTAAESGVPTHAHPMAHTHSNYDSGYTFLSHNGTLSTETAGDIAGNGHKLPQILSGSQEYWRSRASTGAASISNTNNNTAAAAANAHNNMPPYLTVYMWKRTA